MRIFKILFSFLGLNLLEYFSVSKEKHQSRDRSAGEIPFTIVVHQWVKRKRLVYTKRCGICPDNFMALCLLT